MQDLLIAIIISWVLFRLFRTVVFVQWGGPRQHNTTSSHHQRPSQQEGEIKVTKPHPGNKNSSDNVGEYVDYEEIK